MSPIETAVRWRHGTLALFTLLVLFGALALGRLPMELQPGGDIPEITITTAYPGAGPTEVEDLITRPLEDVLQLVEGVKEMTSTSTLGNSSITMEFDWDVDIKQKLIEVINKLNQAKNLPEEASESDVQIASGGGGSNAMMWVILKEARDTGAAPDPDRFRDLLEEEVLPELRRIRGTSRYIIVGGRLKEVEIVVDPEKLAARGLTIAQVSDSLRRNNVDVRGGPLVTGRREYRVSTKNRASEIFEFEDIVLRRDAGGTVMLSDVAEPTMGRQFPNSFFLSYGRPAAAVGIVRQVGANVPALSDEIRTVLSDLERRFQQRGDNVLIQVGYDESEYVAQSMTLVRNNLLLGAVLATIVLLLFLGSLRTVLVCAISIPTTLISVFLLISSFGQTLNILTLAGLAFAVGMVIDNAIVVVENVFTHLEKGKRPVRAAIDGCVEVGGALVASTLTTIAVFFPLVLVDGEAGRVFRALGITLASAVAFSLFAAVTLVPMLAGTLLTKDEANLEKSSTGVEALIARAALWFRTYQRRLIRFLEEAADWSLDPEQKRRRFSVLLGCVGLLTVAYLLLPPADYLPQGNRNIIFWLMEPHPGTSIPEAVELTEAPNDFVRNLEEVGDTFMVYGNRFRGIGIRLKPQYANGRDLQAVVNKLFPVGMSYPGFRFVVPIRIPIFASPGKEFQLRIVGPDLEELASIKQRVEGQLREIPGIVNSRSDFVFGAPELQVLPHREKLAELGMEPNDVATMVEAALGGRFVSEFIEGKETLDVVLELKDISVENPDELRQLQLVTPGGQRVQLQDVAEVLETTGPDSVNHVNVERAITLTVTIAPQAPLGSTVDTVERQVIAPLTLELPPTYRAYISGSADDLADTLRQLGQVFILSLIISYLLLMALYRSFTYPLIIMITVPLGLTGAVVSLVTVSLLPGVSVALDMITAVGFVILIGIVVNNAILLVDRALQLQRGGMEYWESVRQGTRDRLRPILMSATTSVLGMLPLAVIPGDGAELYQGLGIVLVGGLTFATFLTPTVVPALMGIFKDLNLVEDPDDPLMREEHSDQELSSHS